MKINIYSHQDDPAQIQGFTIVIDVFRAFTVSYYVWANQPKRYIITNSIEHALLLKSKFDKTVLIGERDGVKVDGFDFGNSPSTIAGKDFRGRTVIHTTTAGTKGVLDQPEENEVVVGSFVNKDALFNYIRRHDIPIINLY
ncbi:MAG: 2-phosphosulfolactate phosphatase, partial [Calditrichae bacterium]|nr:2-phosphosulfolactate phosphatase [Calditrichia bacterium]